MDSQAINDFFKQYALTMNNALTGAEIPPTHFANSFAGFIIGANPLGVMGGKNDETFINSITNGISFYKRIGVRSMNIVSTELTELDGHHIMAKISWKCIYRSSQLSGEISFDVIYILQVLDFPKIFAFITGDEQEAFRKVGLIK